MNYMDFRKKNHDDKIIFLNEVNIDEHFLWNYIIILIMIKYIKYRMTYFFQKYKYKRNKTFHRKTYRFI